MEANDQIKKNLEDFRLKIDKDEGLKSKRRAVIVVSLILLGIYFTGASVIEANTFILKVEFTNQNGIPFALLLALFYLTIRYYAYAVSYQKTLNEMWRALFFQDSLIFVADQTGNYYAGLIGQELQNTTELGEFFEHGNGCHYVFGVGFQRYLTYPSTAVDQDTGEEVEIVRSLNLTGRSNTTIFFHTKLIFAEGRTEIKALIGSREHLDILGPYIVSVFAIAVTIKSLI